MSKTCDDFLRNKYQTINEGLDILKSKWSKCKKCSGMISAFLYDDCCELSTKLIAEGASEQDIRDSFPAYYED